MNGKHISDNLKSPFRLLTSVTRYKCTRCGHISEINLNVTQKFIRVMEMLGHFPEVILDNEKDFKKYYFEVSHCKRCRNQRREELVIKLKTI